MSTRKSTYFNNFLQDRDVKIPQTVNFQIGVIEVLGSLGVGCTGNKTIKMHNKEVMTLHFTTFVYIYRTFRFT